MQPGQSIFSADLWNAQQKLSALDWIASAEIHRRYPDAIFVSLVEKRPFALWQAPPDAHGEAPIWVVERNGKLITSHDLEKFRRLPKLVGEARPRRRLTWWIRSLPIAPSPHASPPIRAFRSGAGT